MSNGRVLETAVSITGKLDPSISKAFGEVQKKLGNLDSKTVKTAVAAAAVGTAFVTAAATSVKALAKIGDAYNKSSNTLQSQTGATGAELEGLNEVMKEVYANNFGEDWNDVAQGLSKVRQNLKLTGKELQVATEDAFAFRDTFDYDISESSRAAAALMKNFGLTSQESYSMMAKGIQNGLDYSNELLDNISEYSVQFAKVGFDANDMFNLFQAGADSTSWNLDKIGDAVKEFSIRSIDGSKTTIEGFEALGLNAGKTMTILANGGDDAKVAFQEVIKKLMAMDDKVQRDAVGVQLFGTMWEDLGTESMQAIANMNDGLYDTGKTMEDIKDIQYNNIGDAFEAVRRQIEVDLLPVASVVANKIVELAPKIKAATETAIDFASNGIAWVKDNINWLIPAIGGVVTAIGLYKGAMIAAKIADMGGVTAIMALVKAKLVDKAQTVALGLLYIKDAVIKGASTAATVAQTVATGAWNVVAGIATTVTTALGAAFAFLTSPIGLVIVAIAAVVAAGVALYKNWDSVKAFAQGLWTRITEIFDGISSTIGGALEYIRGKFRDVFGALAGMVKAPMNAVIGIVNGAIRGINSISFDMPKILGGGHVGFDIPQIPMLAKGGFTEGVSIAGEAGTEAVLSFDHRYRKENLSYWAKAGQMLGATSDDAGYGILGGTTTTNNGVTITATFAPQVHVEGNAEKSSIIQAIRDEYPEFLDMLEEFLNERVGLVYG